MYYPSIDAAMLDEGRCPVPVQTKDKKLFEILWSVKEGLASLEEVAILQAKGLVVVMEGVTYLTPRGILLFKKVERDELSE